MFFGESTSSVVYFVIIAYIQVDGGSPLLVAGVFLVPIKLPCSHTLHSLDPAYWTPHTAQKPYPSSPSICIVDSLVPPMNPSHLEPPATPKDTLLLSIPLAKKTFTISIYTSSRRINHTIMVKLTYFNKHHDNEPQYI